MDGLSAIDAFIEECRRCEMECRRQMRRWWIWPRVRDRQWWQGEALFWVDQAAYWREMKRELEEGSWA